MSNSHDFDFLHGDWHASHRCLRRRRQGADDWKEFEGRHSCWPILAGAGNVDDFVREDGTAIGSTMRLFDQEQQRWSLHWASPVAGRLDPAMYGRFDDGVGTFFGDDVLEGDPIVLRFIWDEITATGARWQQAFSFDGGSTFETNWVITLTRAAET